MKPVVSRLFCLSFAAMCWDARQERRATTVAGNTGEQSGRPLCLPFPCNRTTIHPWLPETHGALKPSAATALKLPRLIHVLVSSPALLFPYFSCLQLLLSQNIRAIDRSQIRSLRPFQYLQEVIEALCTFLF